MVRTSQPTVSVIVPVRNRRDAIAPCIESLLAQTYRGAELLVVDNDSTDDTRAVVARYPVTLLVERDIRTSYAARNRGVRHAAGAIVAFIDSDCVAAPDWLANLVAAMAEHGAAVGTIADAPPTTIYEELTARVNPFARPQRCGLRTLLTANVAIRRDLLERAGLFDERLPTAGDVDLGWRLQRDLGVRIADAPNAVVWHSHRTTLRGVFAQHRRYGASEILLTTLHRGGAGSLTRGQHARRIARQLRACLTYLAAIAIKRERRWPFFLLVVETGNLAGKLGALLRTRGCRRNPYPNPRLGRLPNATPSTAAASPHPHAPAAPPRSP